MVNGIDAGLRGYGWRVATCAAGTTAGRDILPLLRGNVPVFFRRLVDAKEGEQVVVVGRYDIIDRAVA